MQMKITKPFGETMNITLCCGIKQGFSGSYSKKSNHIQEGKFKSSHNKEIKECDR